MPRVQAHNALANRRQFSRRFLLVAALVALALPAPGAGESAAAPLYDSHDMNRAAAYCRPNLAERLRSTGRAAQLMTVEARRFGTTDALVETWALDEGCWRMAGGPWPALIGLNGFSNHHREGDGTTPTGLYRIGREVYGTDPNPGYRGPYHVLVCGDWWDEDPTSPSYNSFQHLPCGEVPAFAADSEALWTEGNYYPSLAVVEYNMGPVVPYAGSGIFVHASTGAPTVGCVSIPLKDLNEFLRWLDPAKQPVIAMGPASELDGF